MFTRMILVLGLSLALTGFADAQPALKIGTFDVDASPPVGSPLAYDIHEKLQTPLQCRGVVILGEKETVVLCAVDWIGIGNDGLKEFRESLARAAGTTPDQVAVHALHQHDAPRCDFTADRLLAPYQINQHIFDVGFARDVIQRAAEAVKQAVQNAQPVTHLGLGSAKIEKVASNRRILGPDGKVKYVRWTATKDPKVRAMPTGTIDPMLKMISFWNGEKPLVALTYYATHPQSYYRTKMANPDFPGIARNMRQKQTGVLHVHFNGAGGNIGAGKWNDGAKKNRQILADRVAAGMKQAWENSKRTPISADDLGWESVEVKLPPAKHLDEKKLLAILQDKEADVRKRSAAASNLAWLLRCKAGDPIDVSCLRLGKARVLHMPGELFVEYQLAAQKLRPDLFVAMAAYGDYAPGYIGTEIAYGQGGYETSQRASRVAPSVEGILMNAMRKLLEANH